MSCALSNKEWRDLRRKSLGSSDAPVIMGASPWKTPYQLWEEKVFGFEKKDNPAMKRGRELEEVARSHFESYMGIKCDPQFIRHPSLSFMTATLDGYNEDARVLVEIKCPNQEDHFIAVRNNIPEKYSAQLQHQLEVTGCEMMYYYSFDGKNGVIVEVEKDQPYISKLIEKEEKFYQCLIDFIPPKITEKDYLSMDSNTKWIEKAEKWIKAKEELQKIEEKEKYLKNELIELANNQNAQGSGVRLTKIVQRGHIDYSKIPELENVDLENYRKASSIKWRPHAIN